jgi:hypothetical protein
MLRAARLLPQIGLATLRFSTRRFPLALGVCYRAPWRLPGPDFHRLVNTSLHETASSLSITSYQSGPFSGHASGC